MNELLVYIKNISDELLVMADTLDCDGLSMEVDALTSMADGLKEKVKYYQGFAYKEDKKEVRYFFTEMTDDEYREFVNYTGMCKHKFKPVKAK